MLTVKPATVMVPVRVTFAGPMAAVKPTVPLPLPDAPEVMVIHDALLTAFQAQPVAEVTSSVPLSALAVALVVPGLRL